MILYRIRGRCEAFPETGMLNIDPIVDSSLIRLEKRFKQLPKEWKKKGLKFDILLEQVQIKTLQQQDIIDLLLTEDVQLLIKSFKVINRASHESGTRKIRGG